MLYVCVQRFDVMENLEDFLGTNHDHSFFQLLKEY